MAIRPRTRKRVQAVRRAADGSAFKKWYGSFEVFGFVDSVFFRVLYRFVILCFGLLFQ